MEPSARPYCRYISGRISIHLLPLMRRLHSWSCLSAMCGLCTVGVLSSWGPNRLHLVDTIMCNGRGVPPPSISFSPHRIISTHRPKHTSTPLRNPSFPNRAWMPHSQCVSAGTE
ncbi:hypothetical protein HYPSUDRAFT_464880 [Hypholoma sublateritium FD-334 SS-4]|uniref:Uncharacterized protein n=1 Tax=Hypholoma sublateritium (strain FD-334 SS-4) TaxID=945553 RepID=A0A0D2PZJ3_HYPSF|nr:hypothetical protein HYPSUDRAFT_464880 [Hypholoma sublateritium FD-334 SS-4]